jgi:restriction system protein
MSDPIQGQVWSIRAGKGGNAHKLFLAERVIALSDASLGDLSRLEPTRDAFCAAYRKSHTDETRRGSGGIAGKFYRFSNEVRIGDLVLYPSLKSGTIYIGQVVGEYVYDETVSTDFPHQRPVKWKYTVPKSELSKTARYELGAARTFFQFRRHVEEIKAKISDRTVSIYRA